MSWISEIFYCIYLYYKLYEAISSLDNLSQLIIIHIGKKKGLAYVFDKARHDEENS